MNSARLVVPIIFFTALSTQSSIGQPSTGECCRADNSSIDHLGAFRRAMEFAGDGYEACIHFKCVAAAPPHRGDRLFLDGAEAYQVAGGSVAGASAFPGLPGDEHSDSGMAPMMSCALASAASPVGGVVELDLFAQDVTDLRAYQTTIAITRTSGSGMVTVDCQGGVLIDINRSDFVFADLTPAVDFFLAVNCAMKSAVASKISGGIDVGMTPEYLSTYRLTVSGDADNGSTFEISIVPTTSFLLDPSSASIPFNIGPSCVLTVGCIQDMDCHDDNPCTTDTCVANSCQNTNNTLPCSDGDACTLDDSCENGVCVAGAPEICEALDQCHMAGTCDPQSGICSNPALPDGTTCEDGDLCTLDDSCENGVCVADAPVICEALDQCHMAGTCDPQSGICSNPALPDGTACADGDLCTLADSCVNGTCTAGALEICEALNQCHIAGTCDPQSGICSNPSLPDGTACEDGDLCTLADSCVNGTCTAGAPVICEALDQCHMAGTCDPQSGICSNPALPEGTACVLLCAETASCLLGVCEGTNISPPCLAWPPMAACLLGPLFAPSEECTIYDFDGSGSIDLQDVSIFISQ